MYNIILADDKQVFMRQIRRFQCLKDSTQFHVIAECQNGEEVLKILNDQKVDLVITDIRMPILSGLELLEKINERQLCPCVVLLSEYADFEYAKKGLKFGAFDYCVKPIDDNTLGELLQRASEFLDSLQKEHYYQTEAKMLISAMVRQDTVTYEFAEIVADKITVHDNNAEERVLADLNAILSQLKNAVLKKHTWLAKYVDVNRMFIISQVGNKDKDFKADFLDKINEVFETLNRFMPVSDSQLVEKICEYILENIERDIDLQTLADEHYLNNTYLSHIFKQKTDYSLVKYISGIKMERAKRMLEIKEMKVLDVAERLGYRDREYFSKIFKESTGTTPKEYKRKQLCG